jgi:TonB family protein
MPFQLLGVLLFALPAFSNDSQANPGMKFAVSEMQVEVESNIDASNAKVGDVVKAHTIVNFESEDRTVRVPKESKLFGKVVLAASRTRGDMESALGIVLDSAISPRGVQVPVTVSIRAYREPQYPQPSSLHLEERSISGFIVPTFVSTEKNLKISGGFALGVDFRIENVQLYSDSFTTVQIPEELAAKNLIDKIQPIYPPGAMDENVQGTVVLDVLISRSGIIKEVKVRSGPKKLAEAALEVVKKWRYKPFAVDNGMHLSLEPNETLVEVKTQIHVVFQREIKN